jgi:hypothetical protein
MRNWFQSLLSNATCTATKRMQGHVKEVMAEYDKVGLYNM